MTEDVPVLPDICPDCGRSMEEAGMRLSVLDGEERPILRCPQCRLWQFKKV